MEQRSPRVRWFVVWCLAVVWMGAVLGRLSYLQLFCYSDYFTRARRQQQRVIEVNPKRGTIYDRKERELAVSIPMDSCVADPAEISDAAMVASLLSRVVDIPAEEIEKKLREERNVFPLARKLTPEQSERIQALNLRGIYLQTENHRVYPQRTVAAHALGYVDIDEHGLGGIEYSFDKLIRGRPGRLLIQADARRRWYDRTEMPGLPGSNVTLTLDETVQYIAEKELTRAVEESHAKSGTVVIQDPNSGELLALASWPTFDPNDAGKYPDDDRMNLAVSAAYEPGSTFKLITLGGAIEYGVARPSDVIDCQMGSILVAGRLIHDWHPFGPLTVAQVLAHSSDVGAIKIALRLGPSKFYETIRRFHFGEPTGIELPGENRGLFRRIDDWTASSIGSLAIGQEISVTPIQMVSVVSAIANGGMLYRPRVVGAISGHSGATVSVSDRRPAPTRVFEATTAATLQEMMEGVVLEGTGKPAQLSGYTDAGKSGTAQKIDPATGRYSPNQYVASFVGFAPVNEPAVTILVTLDSPVGPHHGGEVAGPVFRRIAEQVLAYMDVTHDVPASPEQEAALKSKPSKPGSHAPSRRDVRSGKEHTAPQAQSSQPTSSLPTVEFGGDAGIVIPSFAGQSVRGVTETCSKIGLTPVLIGSGVAVDQSPEAGVRLLPGGRVTVRFDRVASAVPVASGGEER
jgi:cell division protein FtsI (penicillin-binding protein 3)